MFKRLFKGLSIVIAALILFYFAYQIYSAATPDYTTQTASRYVVADSIRCTGIVVRDEQIIDNSVNGVASYLVADGEKVAKNAVVAEVFSSETAAFNSLVLETLKAEREALESASGTGSSNIYSLNSSIYTNLTALSAVAASSDFSGVGGYKATVLRQISSFSAETGAEIDYSLRIAQLDAKIAECESRDHSPQGQVTTPVSGYFISGVDGYETLADKESLLDMEPDDVAALIAMDGDMAYDPDKAKVIADYSWYFATLIDQSEAGRFYVGQKLEIDFNYAMVSGVSVRVESIKDYEGESQALVVFECDYLNSMLAGLRVESAEISFRNYSGVMVPRAALRQQDGETGVFVKHGNLVEFKQIDIIYRAEDYVVASYITTPSDTKLVLYDEIIVSGKDLYVGKELG